MLHTGSDATPPTWGRSPNRGLPHILRGDAYRMRSRRPVILVLLTLAITATLAIVVFGFVRNHSRNHARGHNGADFVLAAKYQPTAVERSCGKAIIQDWYPDGRVDPVYPLECYGAALGLLPPKNSLVYSTVVEDITRAYQARRSELMR
jgi:hypothetical protein